MNRKALLDIFLALIFAAISAVSLFSPMTDYLKWIFAVVGAVLAAAFLILAVRDETNRALMQSDTTAPAHTSGPTELVLLNEEDKPLASWGLYGKSGLVIGRDVGENQVDVNLSSSAYASMIEVEHAVLNYSGGRWYVEDLASKNGVSVQKSDGRKYKLSPDKPCLLSQGDIIYIALTRLKVR